MACLVLPLSEDTSVRSSDKGHFYVPDQLQLAVATGRNVIIYQITQEQLLSRRHTIPFEEEVMAVKFSRHIDSKKKDSLVVIEKNGQVTKLYVNESTWKIVREPLFRVNPHFMPQTAFFDVNYTECLGAILLGVGKICVFDLMKKVYFVMSTNYMFLADIKCLPYEIIGALDVSDENTTYIRRFKFEDRSDWHPFYSDAMIRSFERKAKSLDCEKMDVDMEYCDKRADDVDMVDVKDDSSFEELELHEIGESEGNTNEILSEKAVGRFTHWLSWQDEQRAGYVMLGPQEQIYKSRGGNERGESRMDLKMFEITSVGMCIDGKSCHVATSNGGLFYFEWPIKQSPTTNVSVLTISQPQMDGFNVRYGSVTSTITCLGDTNTFFGSLTTNSSVFNPYVNAQKATQSFENIGCVVDMSVRMTPTRLNLVTVSGVGRDSTIRVVGNYYRRKQYTSFGRPGIVDIFPLKMLQPFDTIILTTTNDKTDVHKVTDSVVETVNVNQMFNMGDKTLLAMDIPSIGAAIQICTTSIRVLARFKKMRNGLEYEEWASFVKPLPEPIIGAVVDSHSQTLVIFSENRWLHGKIKRHEDRVNIEWASKLVQSVLSLELVETNAGKYLIFGFAGTNSLEVKTYPSLEEHMKILLPPESKSPTSIKVQNDQLFVSLEGGIIRYERLDLDNKRCGGSILVPEIMDSYTLRIVGDLLLGTKPGSDGIVLEKHGSFVSCASIEAVAICGFHGSYYRNTYLISDCQNVMITHLTNRNTYSWCREKVTKMMTQSDTDTLAFIALKQEPAYARTYRSIIDQIENIKSVSNDLKNKDAWENTEKKEVCSIVVLNSTSLKPHMQLTLGPYETAHQIASGRLPFYTEPNQKVPNRAVPFYAVSTQIQNPFKPNRCRGRVFIFTAPDATNFSSYGLDNVGSPNLLRFQKGVLFAGFGNTIYRLSLNIANQLKQSINFNLANSLTIDKDIEMEIDDLGYPRTLDIETSSSSSFELLSDTVLPDFRPNRNDGSSPVGIISTTNVIGMADKNGVTITHFGFNPANLRPRRSLIGQLNMETFWIGSQVSCLRETCDLTAFYPEMESQISSNQLVYGLSTGGTGWIFRLTKTWSNLLERVERAIWHSEVFKNTCYLYLPRFETRRNASSGNVIDGEVLDIFLQLDEWTVESVLRSVVLTPEDGLMYVYDPVTLRAKLVAFFTKAKITFRHSMSSNRISF